MVYKEGQTFKVKSPEEMLLGLNYSQAYDGSIKFIKNGVKSKEQFNPDMQQFREVTVRKPVSQSCFIGDNGWFWYDWMLNIPIRPTLMETE